MNNRRFANSTVGWLRKCHQFNRSTQSAWKQCGARHARLNRVKCTVAKWFAQSTSEWPKTLPRGFKGPQPLGTPFSSIFRRATKDGAVGDRWFSRAASKNVKRKIPPPVDVGLAVRPVKPPHQFFCTNVDEIPHRRSGGIEDQILHLADPGPEHILTHLNIK